MKKPRKKKAYSPPQIHVVQVELEHSIAASSATATPGGGANNNAPWITEEETETKENDWDFFD